MQVLVPPICDTAMETLQGATEEKGEKTVFVLGCCDAPGWAYGEEGYWRAQGGEVKKSAEEVQPWVMEKSAYEGMGYLNTARRVRKYL